MAAQSVMLIAMMVEHRWLFAMMVFPGLIGALASVLLTLSQTAQANPATTSNNAHCEHEASSEHSSSDFALMQCPALETLIGLDADCVMWRTIVRQWLEPPSLDALVGVGTDGDFHIDLAQQGPHALLAGTTGSGKSVLLQSWCLAMACRNGPDVLHFVFLDFKGGSAFSALEQLPHAVGSVCDLNLKHAVRALKALEAELTRRERMVACERVGSVSELRNPPARLIIVIDEFHALKNQLPDYVDRLVHIAALGRSLGMHVIACTQNPLGQVSADMKANMALNICLRVRDPLQSVELLGDGRAASISPSLPGCAWRNDGESVAPLRCAAPRSISTITGAIELARSFHGITAAQPLFTAPLPTTVHEASLHAQAPIPVPRQTHSTTSSNSCNNHKLGIRRIPFALADDGAQLTTATLPIGEGNIGVIGPHGRGKTTLLALLAAGAARVTGIHVRISERVGREYHSRRVSAAPSNIAASPSQQCHMLWIVDDADALFDPFSNDPLRTALLEAIADRNVTVVFAVESSKHIRVPEHCRTRIVFPSGERSVDLMDGIPATVLAEFDQHDLTTAGRAALVSVGHAEPIQIALPTHPGFADGEPEDPCAVSTHQPACSMLDATPSATPL
ncbi:FtsK/SpoIIIE domain-containing protein [Bifidobacterium goeldii]|nr:FtsK/SpoIIIE domain-containing protein [Bifidobacterium goeldii]